MSDQPLNRLTEDVVRRIENALEERKRNRRRESAATTPEAQERRRSPGRRESDQAQ